MNLNRFFLAMGAVIAVVLALMIPAGKATAQDLRYSSQNTLLCLNDAGSDQARQRACVGESASVCIGATADGSTTIGMGFCLDREWQYWDARLNASYRVIRDKARLRDVETKEIGSPAAPTAIALRDAQRAWIAWRDATCDFEMSQWGGGTGGGPALVSCLLRLTGDQALYLEQAWIGD